MQVRLFNNAMQLDKRMNKTEVATHLIQSEEIFFSVKSDLRFFFGDLSFQED
jgi:hypothetical protein